jgi:hypothetical protein
VIDQRGNEVITKSQEISPVELRTYSENRSQVPTADVARYAGQYVAWSLDGRHIFGHAVDSELLEKQLAGAGIDPEAVVIGYIDALDEAFLG